jgi:hypothetical protein
MRGPEWEEEPHWPAVESRSRSLGSVTRGDQPRSQPISTLPRLLNFIALGCCFDLQANIITGILYLLAAFTCLALSATFGRRVVAIRAGWSFKL